MNNKAISKNRCPGLRVLFFLLWFSGIGQAATGPVGIELETPRDFGYSLGDKVTLIAHISLPLFYTLETGFLPKPGPVNEWLQLESARLVEAKADDDYTLAVTYQIFKSVPATTELTLPALPLHFKHQGRSLTENMPAWTFSYHPLIPKSKTDAQIEPEAETLPTLMFTGESSRKLTFLVTLISMLLFYIIWFYGKVPFLERYSGAFGKACKTLKQLKKQAPSPETRRKALQCFHRALNELAGETVFADRLPAFFGRFPKYIPLQEKTEAFFRISQNLFFTGNADTEALTVEQIESLCLLYRKLERSSRCL